MSAVLSGAVIVFTLTTEVLALVHGHPGAHRSLYSAAILFAVVAASCLSFAFARELIGQAAVASAADHDAQTSAMRRLADEVGGHAAETADVVTTLEQLVAELARMRMALRESEANRRTDAQRHLDELTRLTEHVAEQAAEIRHLRAGLRERDERLTELVAEYERVLREDVPRAIRRAEARGYVAGFRQRLAERHRPDRGRTRPD